MTTYTITPGNVGTIGALDLRGEALAALERGEARITVDVRPYAANPAISVETLIIHAPGGASGDIGRAGQVTTGNAAWGDYDPESETIALDDSSTVVDLDGREV